MKSALLLVIGMILGIWTSWPGIFVANNWRCFKDIISNSSAQGISFKAALSVSPNYLLKGKSNNKASKIRIVSDACFR